MEITTKLAIDGSGWESKKEKNKDIMMGKIAWSRKGTGILKLDSRAVSMEGIGRSSSQERACLIRAKKVAAMEKPIICTKPVHKIRFGEKEKRKRIEKKRSKQ